MANMNTVNKWNRKKILIRFTQTGHLCPRLNASIVSIVELVLHIWQGHLTFSYYSIYDRTVCGLVVFTNEDSL